ncbi:MAG: 3-phosphoshikimate 1-carboxyvinyltransferase [Firmicutes bacterium]|nr:3-phosphoshikimate 1-carboxyvinyltransferase [Bacillota bacterium]
MKVKITPSKVGGSISIPSSKSMAHRAIICASLAKGISKVSNITYSKDIDATISCMESLGAKIQKFDTYCIVEGTNLEGTENITCNCNESGSTLRFLIPIASLTNQKVTFLGQGRLLSRPMSVYQNIFDEQNLTFNQSSENIQIEGSLRAQEYKIPGDISSQFITGLLFTLPLLKKDSTIVISEPFESKSYVNLTIQMLEKFGIQIEETSSHSYFIKGNQEYKVQDVTVEGDYSQMAFFGVLASLQESLTCTNMDPHSKQGDMAILDQIKKAGAILNINQDSIEVQHHSLTGQTIDLSNCPDLGPILCVLAAYSKGCTHIINAGRLRIKESDRIEAMETELKKWGVEISSTEDSITIVGKESYENDSMVEIFGHNDHRIVMAMCVFGLCAKSECIIDDAQAITKSYPTFFKDIQSIGGKVEQL